MANGLGGANSHDLGTRWPVVSNAPWVLRRKRIFGVPAGGGRSLAAAMLAVIIAKTVMRSVADDVNQFLSAHRGAIGGRVPNTPLGFDQLLRDGFPLSVVSTICDVLELDRKSLAALLQMNRSTLGRRLTSKKPFTGAQADVLYRVLGTLGTAMRVLKTPANVSSWLKRPQRGLGDAMPFDLLKTSAGTEAVNLLLEQMYYGIVP